jgi:cytochrome c oxidase subunit 3
MADTSNAHAHLTEEHGEDTTQLWEGGKSPFRTPYGKLMMWYFLLSDAFTFAGFLIAYGALRFSSKTWPEPDFVFASFPFLKGHLPLLFVTFMTFVLIISSVTMVRAVQEGARENQRGVVFWMLMTILGGATFLGSQAYEWTTLLVKEGMSVRKNPFGRHAYDGVYLNPDGTPAKNTDGSEKTFQAGQSYLLEYEEASDGRLLVDSLEYKDNKGEKMLKLKGNKILTYVPIDPKTPISPEDPAKLKDANLYEPRVTEAAFGPKAFGGLFFFITGFHGFHVFSGVLFLAIIMVNAGGGLYAARKNGYEMVEKMGLYWHFVDLVWVFVFLVFYLL